MKHPKRSIKQLTAQRAYGRGYTAGKKSADKNLVVQAEALRQQVVLWENRCAELREQLRKMGTA